MEELINHKNELNKKNKEFHNLKISFLKLDEENKKNIKIIEDIIIEAGRGKKDGEMSNLSPEELENEIKNIMAYTHPSDKMLYKLKEVIKIFMNIVELLLKFLFNIIIFLFN